MIDIEATVAPHAGEFDEPVKRLMRGDATILEGGIFSSRFSYNSVSARPAGGFGAASLESLLGRCVIALCRCRSPGLKVKSL